MTLRRTFPACATSEIPRLFPHSVRSFFLSTLIVASFHSWGTCPPCHTALVIRWSSRRTVRFSWSPSLTTPLEGRPGQLPSHFHRPQSSGNFILCWLFPKCLRDGPLRDFGDDCRIERLRFCVQQRAEVSYPSLADEIRSRSSSPCSS